MRNHPAYRNFRRVAVGLAVAISVGLLLLLVFRPRPTSSQDTALRVRSGWDSVPDAEVIVVDGNDVVAALVLLPFSTPLGRTTPESAFGELFNTIVVAKQLEPKLTDADGRLVLPRLEPTDYVLVRGRVPGKSASSSSVESETLWFISAEQVDDGALSVEDGDRGGQHLLDVVLASPELRETLLKRLSDEAEGIAVRQQFDSARHFLKNAADLLGSTQSAAVRQRIDQEEAKHWCHQAENARDRGDYELARQLADKLDQLAPDSGDKTRLLQSIAEHEGGLAKVVDAQAGGANCAAFSPNGQRAVSAGNQGTVLLWETGGWQKLRQLGPKLGPVAAVAYSPRGDVVLAGDKTGAAVVLDIADGQLLRRLQGASSAITAVAFSPDGEQAAVGDQDGLVRLYRIKTGDQLHSFSKHRRAVTGVAFSPKGRQVYSASADGTVRLWLAETAVEQRSFSADESPVMCMSLAPDGQLLLTGSDDMRLRIFATESGEEQRRMIGNPSIPRAVAFSPDGRLAASGHDDRTVRLWNVEEGNLLETFQVKAGPVCCVLFSPDGTRVLSCSQGDPKLRLWVVAKEHLGK